MISVAAEILTSSLPLLLAATGALVTELAGVMAVFIDGIINAGSFFTLAFGQLSGSVVVGIAASCIICTAFTGAVAWFTEKSRANPFVTGIAMNLFLSGVVSLCSQQLYGTKGVIYTESVIAVFTQSVAAFGRTGMLLPVIILCGIILWSLRYTVWGLRTRCTGTAPDVLLERGSQPAVYRITAWCTAAMVSSLAGSLFTLRLSSFVPNISAGKGWIALAAVFLGRDTLWGTVGAVLFFSITEYLANNWAQLSFLPAISPTILLALPYVVCLLLFFLMPKKNVKI